VATLAIVAAMISERDPFLKSQSSASKRPPTQNQSRWNCDVTQRFLALHDYYTQQSTHSPFGEIHRGAARTIQRVAQQLANHVGVELDSIQPSDRTEEHIQRCLLAAFPDRLARRRKPQDTKGRMVGGRGVRLAPSSGVLEAEYFLCVDVDAGKVEANVRLASGVDLAWLPTGAIETREEQFFNPTRKQVEARRRSYFRDLLLCESPVAITDEAHCREILLSESRKQLAAILPDDKASFHSFVARLNCLRTWAPELGLPACNDELLFEVAEDLCVGRRSFAELCDAPWLDWLRAKLTPVQQRAIDEECPERITVPNGNQKKLAYTEGKPPVLAVRIQEIFSWTDTPRIAFGRQPVLLHLLAPNMRPQQVTDDLASFWENTYPVVRKELRRRYPKHAWPEDPLKAKPTR
jgi:ATP-dependent helicase HrpB